MTATKDDRIREIEELIVGKGAPDFRALEKIVDVFCPFEAIGMIDQEIRHSHYLTYILNPNRPHGFGDTMLQGFLGLVAEGKGPDLGFSKMDLHFWDGAQAVIRREWRDIDLLIELPTPNGKTKGLVVAVELKINAKESERQLAKYQAIVQSEYDGWTQVFVFLTKNNKQPSEANKKTWMPLALETMISRLKEVADHQGFKGQSADVFFAYEAMLRRHHLPNTKLEELARKIWTKHKEALDVLYEHRPNLLGDLQAVLSKKHGYIIQRINAKLDENKFGLELVEEKSSRGYIRFGVKNWNAYDQLDAGTDEWLPSKRLMFIEIYKHRDALVTALVMGPSDRGFREKLYQEIFKRSKLSEGASLKNSSLREKQRKWEHLSATAIAEIDLKNGDHEGTIDLEKLADESVEAFVTHWSEVLPRYDVLIKDLWGLK